MYNLTNITASNNPLQLIIAVNQLSGQWFGIMMYLSTLLIFFIATKSKWTTERSMVATGFTGLMLGMALRAINLIPDILLFLTIILAAGSIAYMYIKK